MCFLSGRKMLNGTFADEFKINSQSYVVFVRVGV